MKEWAVDGGGCFGVITAALTRDKDPLSEFDCAGATSIGTAIVAWIFMGKDPADLLPIMRGWLPEVFNRNFLSYHTLTPFGSRWPNKVLVEFCKKNYNVKMKDLKKPVFITSYDYSKRRPKIFSSIQDGDYPLWMAVLASVSAPTYFDPMGAYVDGGLFANDPSMVLAAASIDQLGADIHDIEMMSLGQGKIIRPDVDMSSAKRWTKLDWASGIIDNMLEGTSEAGSVFIASQMPFKQYCRWNKVRLENGWSMDDASLIDENIRRAEVAKSDFDEMWKKFFTVGGIHTSVKDALVSGAVSEGTYRAI